MGDLHFRGRISCSREVIFIRRRCDCRLCILSRTNKNDDCQNADIGDTVMDVSAFYLALIVGQLNRSETYNPDMPIDKVDTNSAGQILYSGIARRGAGSSDSVWFIRKWAYDSSGNYTGSTYAYNAAWDNRTTETYS